MYFETASFALSSVVCAISRIFSACSLIWSLIALSLRWLTSSLLQEIQSLLRRLLNLLQLSAQLIDQHPRILAVIDRPQNQMPPAVLEGPLERRNKVVRAFDLGALGAIALGVFDEIRVAERQAEIREMVH